MLVDVEGCRINVEVEGPEDAPAVVFSNSLGTNLHMWDDQATALAKHFRVIRYDQRGHGKSDAPKPPYSLERLGRDVLAILDHLGIKSAHFVGLSMGGCTGMWLGRHARGRFGKLVLSNTGAKIGDAALWNDRIQSVLKDGMKAVAEVVLERWFTPNFRKREPAVVKRVREMLLTTPPAGYAGCSAALRDMDERAGIAEIKAPTLVIAGKHDPATPPESGEFIASRIKDAKFVVLDAAHLANLEQSATYTDTIEKFLRKD
jgi:3-oxoadipate enol-lactonase